jgi:hypothetical protein
MQNEQLYRALYSKYAPDLSQEELDEKLEYASTLDINDFVNNFYQKYTGQGPNKEQVDYMNTIIEKPKQAEKLPEDKGFIEDMVQVFQQSTATAGTIDEAFDIYKLGKDISDEQIQALVDAKNEMDKYGPTREQVQFSIDQKKRGGGIVGTLLALKDNPAFIPQFLVGSAVTMGASLQAEEVLGTTAASAGIGAASGAAIGSTGFSAGPLGVVTTTGGAITGAGAGAIGGLVGSMETGLTLMELIQEEVGEGVQLTIKNIRELLNDTEKFEKIKQRAYARGRNIGAVEAMTFGISRGVGSQLVKTGKFRRAGVVTTGIETTGGFTGEIAGQIGAEQDVDLGEATLEAIGEITGPGQIVNVSEIARGIIKKSEYNINGEKRSKQEILDLIQSDKLTNEEKTKIKFNVKNDEKFAQFIGGKLNDISLETQIDAKVEDPADRSKLVDLEKQRAKAEADTKKSGIFKVINADLKLENIEKQINEIVGKYTAIDGRTAGVRARKKTAQDVRLNRKNILMDKITQGVKESRTYKQMDIETKEVDTELEARELFEENINKEILILQEELKNIELSSEEKSQIENELRIAKGAIKNIDSKKAEAGLAHGFLLEDAQTGKMTIVINKEKALADSGGNINVAAHEFLHAVLKRTFGDKSALAPASDLMEFLNKNKQLDGTDFIARLQSYQPGETQNQEVFTLLSDSILTGDITYNEGFAEKLSNLVSDFLTAYIPGRKIKFKDGRDAFRFIKNYNKSVQGSRIASKLVEKAQKEGIKIEGEQAQPTPTPLSKEASDNVQRIYDEQGEAGAMDIIDAFKPITSKIVERRSQAPNFDRQLLTDEIETGKRGIFDLIRSYDPNKGVPLAAYINQNLPSRAIEASRRVLGEEFTEDITERVDVAAEEVTTETKAKPKPKKIVLADRLNIAKEVDAAVAKILPDLDIDKLTFKNLKNKVPSTVGKLFGIAPKKLITNANITKSELQKSQMFINKNADLLIKMLPEGSTEGGMATGVPKTLLNEFYTKGKRAKMAKTGTKAGLPIQQKNNINKKQFLEVFGIVDGKPNRTDRNTSARVLSLANTLGKMITNQAVRQQVQTETFRALEDGKSTFMFSKADLAIAKRFKQEDTYYKIDSKEAAERYIKEDVPKLIKVFEDYPGLLNANELVNGLDINTELKEIIRTELRKIPELQVRGKYPKRELSKWINNFFPKGSRLSTGQLTVEKLKKAGESRINEFNKQSGINFDAHWKAIDKALSKDPTLLGPILIYLGNAQNSRTHIQRSGAEFTAYDKTIKGKVYLEHALQNVKAYRTLIEASMNDKTENRDNFKKAFKALKSNYKLIGVSVADNKKLDDSGYKLEMPKNIDGSDWSIFNNNWWDRYINEKVNSLGGINFENFKVIGSKNNLAQELNIPILKLDIKQGFTLSKAMNNSRVVKDAKGISILDFDDTLATTESLVKYTAPDGKLGTLNAEQFASTYEDLQDQGYTFDFSDFNKVVKGKLAPLFNKAIKLQGKFGPENMFVLTARPPQAQKAIFDFLKANGLNIPLKNITGLGNSTSEAKALWVADKVGEGYNDFYFADDALQNVQAVKNMLDQFDVKSKVQQAKIKFSKGMSREFNDILEGSTGVESMKEFSDAQAKIRGARTKYKSIIPASAQDFAGLLYNFLGRSKKGEADMAFFKKALIDPFARGINDLNASKQSAANDYENLQKQYPQIKKTINKKAGELNFTNDQAVRVYLWDKAGFDIPGLSKRDLDSLKKVVNKNADLKAFAEGVGIISKEEAGYSAPGDFWLAETITSDLLSDSNIGDKRADFLAEWQQNRDVIFSPQNLNKIEAIYGSKFREALQDILYRMETGRNRPTGSGRLMNTYMNWVNNSVGAIMFFNMRSALLQTISATNFINWSDNNPLKAAAAFANQPQYWKDFAFLFNSDFLKQRRAGNQRGINEAELSSAVAGAENKAKAAIAWLLKKGFLPTQIADSFAIASGGATFYRNRFKKYIKEGLTQQQAEEKAFLDFQETSEVAQQSARPDMISQQQASPLGRLILAFQNTPMQYARIINKASRDLVNGRGDYKTHISKIAYYGVVQSIIFGALQSALFAALGEDEEEEYDKKKERILNGALDSILSGIGYGGKAISTVKNTAMTYLKERDKGFRADHTYTILSLLSFSPPIGSKLRKIYSSIQTEKFNKDVFKRRGFSLDNPIWSGIGNVVEGFTNIPLGRLSNKMLNIDNALDANNELWQRLALVLGWNTWDLGIKDPDIEAVKTEIKEERKQESKKQAVQKAEEKKKEKEIKEEAIIKENKKKKDGRCAAVSSSGKRCKNEAVKNGLCTIHEETKKLKGGRKVQCRKRKADGKRCKMQTSNKSQFCYYHD